MGELPLKELVSRLQAGTPFHEIKDIRQTAYLADTVEPLPEDINLFSHEECLHDKLKQAKNFKHIEEESNKQQASRILQKVGKQTIVVNPPFPPMTEEGMQFDRGYLSAYFVTNTEKMECEMEKPYILIYDKKISNLKDFLPILEPAVQTGRPLLVIAEDVDSEALTTLVVNRLRSQLKICAVKAPGFGDRRKEMLEDIAILTGGVVISEEKGLKLEQATIEMLGTADKVTVTKDYTTVVNGAGNKDSIKERCEQIKAQIVATKSDYDREKLQERLAKLSGGVAVLYVGAASEVEMKEKKDRVDDALRTFCVQPEVRYWFGQVDGLFTGVHIGVASYNYALKNSTYRYQNSDTGTPLLNMGLTAGYRLSLGKGGCWCLEFSLGAGYAYLDYDRFFNIPGGAYVDTRHKNFFGIDHAGISVGYRIDWKGGRR